MTRTLHSAIFTAIFLCVSACDNFTPAAKTGGYNPVTKQAILPGPCPDWSQSQTGNVLNEVHSNFGCSVNTNLILQLDDPHDIVQGHGTNKPDNNITTGVIESYRAGKLPLSSTPIDTTGSSSQ